MDLFIFLTFLWVELGHCQINLGTINLNRNQGGDLEFGFGQAANIFGFGGDRNFEATIGPGKFDTKVDGGALIGGERLGLDGQVGVRENQALNLGSNIKFGNGPPNPSDPAGQLNTFINNIGYFFQRFMPPPTQPEVASRQRPTDPLPTLMPEHETSTPFDYELIFTSTDSNRYSGESEEESGISPFEEILTKSGEARSKVTTEGEFSTDSQEEKQDKIKRNRPKTPDGLIEFQRNYTKSIKKI